MSDSVTESQSSRIVLVRGILIGSKVTQTVSGTQISILVDFNIFSMTEKCTIYIVHE